MNSSHRNRWLAVIALLAVVAAGIGYVLAQTVPSSAGSAAPTRTTSLSREVSTDAAGLRYLVAPSRLTDGGPGKDGVPSIDHPQYVTVDEAAEWIADDELVLTLIYRGVTRVYPLQILVWHDIVNDVVAGEPLLITYCPLSGSGIAYERVIGGSPVEFGTSGKLYNSNLVMYDRTTDSYWSQIDGLAIVGDLAGQELVSVNVDTVVWGNWKAAHPDSEVLSRDTGFDREYGRDPYGNYCTDGFVLFPVEERDNRVHPKTVVFAVELNGVSAAYREDDLIALGSIDDRLNGVRIRISRDDDGAVSVTNQATLEPIAKDRTFWFAWYAFHPDTRLYRP